MCGKRRVAGGILNLFLVVLCEILTFIDKSSPI